MFAWHKYTRLVMRVLSSRASVRELFSIDSRSLAVTRIGTGIIILIDLVLRAPDITALYLLGGVSPRTGFLDDSWSWSLHTLFASSSWVVLLFCLHAIAAVALILGARTRAATIIVFILTVSLQHANMTVLYGADVIARIVLCIGMFLPWGMVWSYDAYRKGKMYVYEVVYSPWTIVIVLQLVFVYAFAFLHKSGPEWVEGTAVFYVLTSSRFPTMFGDFLGAYPALSPILGIIVLVIQGAAPFLFLSPLYTRWTRTFGVLLTMLMHAAFGLTLYLGWFSYMMIAALALLIPPALWDYALRLFGFSVAAQTPLSRASSNIPSASLVMCGSALLYIVLVFALNVENLATTRSLGRPPIVREQSLEPLMRTIGIDQHWAVFAPRPPFEQTWPIILVTYADGSTSDAVRDFAEVTWERPEHPPVVFGPERWANYYSGLLSGRGGLMPSAIHYFCSRVRERGGTAPVSISIIAMRGPRHYQDPLDGPFAATYLERASCE